MSAYGASFDLLEELQTLLSESHRIVVPTQVLGELRKISRGGGRAGSAARLALKLAERLETVESSSANADQAIVELAARSSDICIVCTNDAELKNILKANGVRVIGVRDYSHLDFS